MELNKEVDGVRADVIGAGGTLPLRSGWAIVKIQYFFQRLMAGLGKILGRGRHDLIYALER